MKKAHRKSRFQCANCGESKDLSYILWEGRRLCASCFAEEVGAYAESYPFLLAQELRLDVIQAPERKMEVIEL